MTEYLYPTDGDLYQKCHRRACEVLRVGEPHPRFGRVITLEDQRGLAVRIYWKQGGTWGAPKHDETKRAPANR